MGEIACIRKCGQACPGRQPTAATHRIFSDSGRPRLGQGPELLEVDVSLPAALELLQGLSPRAHLSSFLFVVFAVHLG